MMLIFYFQRLWRFVLNSENIKDDGKGNILPQGCNSWNKSAKSQSLKNLIQNTIYDINIGNDYEQLYKYLSITNDPTLMKLTFILIM
jgi:hypothetical protein